MTLIVWQSKGWPLVALFLLNQFKFLHRWWWPCLLGSWTFASVCYSRPLQSRNLCHSKHYQIFAECFMLKWSNFTETNSASSQFLVRGKQILQEQCASLQLTCGTATSLSCIRWHRHCPLVSGSASWLGSFWRSVLYRNSFFI